VPARRISSIVRSAQHCVNRHGPVSACIVTWRHACAGQCLGVGVTFGTNVASLYNVMHLFGRAKDEKTVKNARYSFIMSTCLSVCPSLEGRGMLCWLSWNICQSDWHFSTHSSVLYADVIPYRLRVHGHISAILRTFERNLRSSISNKSCSWAGIAHLV
jgi:hypothetical protein